MNELRNGHITSPSGFLASAIACGLKNSRDLDLTLLLSENDCCGAGVFTCNRLPAAPVILDKETLEANPTRLRGIVANAGIANACTGSAGLEAARASQQLAAIALHCAPEAILVLSTGVIGVPLDMRKISSGIQSAAKNLSPENGLDAARAIMTTDTQPKHAAYCLPFSEGTVTIGGIAKGAGMIHPNMATMLAVLTTDALLQSDKLQELLQEAVDETFNCISVDGDTSTNDTVLLLANGASGVSVQTEERLRIFAHALKELCRTLAHAIIRDGEGASKFITIEVAEAGREAEARSVAQTIATSPLVKTAFAGGNPNWGRILAAAGRAGVELDPARIKLWIGSRDGKELQLVDNGSPLTYDQAQAEAIFCAPEFTVRLSLGMGNTSITYWTCDLTHEYVSINADYRT
ncbi:MAG: bifunctional ornithine acetyltransferase/N-acetylglutamate synthase [Chloroflexi bacterium RBG_16_48_8]|nr:MAG: bifunctional ornithine acetyltransferase/N-acetylglutamate synthase [Chloroflexi bacterium RBG_16_48_8]